MENYEKRYRHAIDVVKKYSGAHIMLTEDLIGEMFPELIEDNDEKIRTELIRLISDWSDDGRASTCGYLTSIPKKDILDWLERQKSLFSDNEKRDVWEYVEKFKENYGHYPKDADEIGVVVSAMVNKKKPINSNKGSIELTDFESALFTTFSEIWQDYMLGKEINVAEVVKEHSEELLSIANKQNKPVVFEGKDQGRYEDIRDILYELLNNDKYTRSAIECDLKWFTERFRHMKPQPNVEWSEEMKDAVDAEITKISPNDHLRVVSDALPLKDESEWGTKVKIIIIKQE